MPVPSVIHERELQRVAADSYISRTFAVALIDAPGTEFDATDDFNTIMGFEVEQDLGGYQRQQIGFVTADLGAYGDGKLPLARKAATFTHNGSVNETIRFSHVALLNPSDTAITCISKLAARAALSDGQSAVFYFDFTLYGVYVVPVS